jgi:hypothetical protein
MLSVLMLNNVVSLIWAIVDRLIRGLIIDVLAQSDI